MSNRKKRQTEERIIGVPENEYRRLRRHSQTLMEVRKRIRDMNEMLAPVRKVK